jgi:hypothetical protein
MERTITHEGARWRVAVYPSPAEAGSESGLDLLFTEVRGERRLAHHVDCELLGALSLEAPDLDESTLHEALSAALASERRGAR